MKWILAALVLSFSFMVGCQCTERAGEMDPPPAGDTMGAPDDMDVPAEGAEMPGDETVTPTDEAVDESPDEDGALEGDVVE